jgi:hypothetical protein
VKVWRRRRRDPRCLFFLGGDSSSGVGSASTSRVLGGWISIERFREVLAWASAGREVAASGSLGVSDSGFRRLSLVCGRFCLPCSLFLFPGSCGGGDGDCVTRRNSVVDRSVLLLLLLKFFRFLHILLVCSRPLDTAATMSSAVVCVWLLCSDDVVCGAVFPVVVSALRRGSVKSASAAVTPPAPETLPGPQRQSHLQSQRHGLRCRPRPYWRGD